MTQAASREEFVSSNFIHEWKTKYFHTCSLQNSVPQPELLSLGCDRNHGGIFDSFILYF